jgi:cytochrome P450
MTVRVTAHDWDPRAPEVLDDQIRAYDGMRQRCPIAHSGYLHWSLFRHADVLQVLNDPDRFSNAVSRHQSIPNGMDPPQHTPWRALVDRYFEPPRIAAFEPVARAIAGEMVRALPCGDLEWMDAFAHDCAVRLLCGFMGWPRAMQAPLREWVRRNQAATLSGDRGALEAVAFEFDGHIRTQLQRCRAEPGGDDVTSRLLRDEIEGRPLADEEIVSIVRNWTVGELSTLAACLGILAQYLAQDPRLQQRLREEPPLLGPAIDEILRIHPPLVSNRRVVRQPVEVGGRTFVPGDRLTLMWGSANRDEQVFGDPDAFRLDREPSQNLLYGAGLHACPGAEVSRLQLRVVMETLLAGTRRIAPAAGQPVRARYPASGFSVLPLRVQR